MSCGFFFFWGLLFELSSSGHFSEALFPVCKRALQFLYVWRILFFRIFLFRFSPTPFKHAEIPRVSSLLRPSSSSGFFFLKTKRCQHLLRQSLTADDSSSALFCRFFFPIDLSVVFLLKSGRGMSCSVLFSGFDAFFQPGVFFPTVLAVRPK